ncbi:hypothetical protein FACS1894208_10360 [Clostridia bacterium]|nr:hypothetical protein FACS1894208_10360 [Clostridia bacterium]
MRKATLKSGTVILIYSLILTAVFILCLYMFRDISINSANKGSTGGVVYILTDEDWLEYYTQGEIVNGLDKPIPLHDINSYVAARSFKYLPLVAIFFATFLFVSLGLVWNILRRIGQKEADSIIKTLNLFEDSDESKDLFDPVIKESIKRIRQKFSDHLDDYKRLNSYVSHEQKNAISILRTNLEMGNDIDSVKIIDRISDNMDDIMTLSENADPSIKSPVDVALICASACDSYNKFSESIVFDFDEEDNTVVLAKERWIYRAVSNLLDNAVKYGEGKPIEVAVRNMSRSVILTVRDHGIGIQQDKQEHIFQNRYRVNELNRDGYGIGLSLVSHVCDLCAGFVFVESLESKGSCFYLSFPEYKEDSKR